MAADAADYLLLLDADMTVEQLAPLPELTADAYLLRHAGDLDYAIPRLVRADRGWWYEGSTHEYLATDGSLHPGGALLARDPPPRRRRVARNKLERDRRLLEAELERNPEDQRATFYLAQTLKDSGEREAAIDLYRRRVELGGWDEEVFYAAFQVAMITAEEDPEAALGLYLDAHELRPARAEPLHQLAYLCRDAGRHRAAYMFARRGLEIAYPEDRLFVHRDTYEWGLLLELTIAAYWCDAIEEGLEACDALLSKPASRPRFERRRSATGAPWPGGPPVIPRRPTAFSSRPRWRPSSKPGPRRSSWRSSPTGRGSTHRSPSPGTGFRAIVRTASYELTEEGWYRSSTRSGACGRSTTSRPSTPSWASPGSSLSWTNRPGPELHDSMVEGYEDLRLVEVAGSWYALATVRDRNPENTCEIVLLALDGPTVRTVAILPGPTPGRHEKNWMPYSDGERLRIVYSCGPTVVFDCDPRTGALSERSRHDAPPGAAALRGGSQGVAVDGGHLFVVHDVLAVDEARRAYGHRFVRIDAEGRLTHASPRWSFAGERIELCAGMALRDGRLVISYGVGDRSARLAVCSLEDVLATLQPADAELD